MRGTYTANMTRIVPWIVAAALVTVIALTALMLARQLDRAQADDDPARLASQVAAELRSGASTTVDASPHVDLSRSLATWVVIEDAQGQATSGTGYLKNRLVSLPSTTLVAAAAAGNGGARVTWEPSAGQRFATVTLPVGDRFVSAGQSLAPVEDRQGALFLTVALGWLVSLVVLGLGYGVTGRRVGRPLSPSAD